jgi:hypothetical protein
LKGAFNDKNTARRNFVTLKYLIAEEHIEVAGDDKY